MKLAPVIGDKGWRWGPAAIFALAVLILLAGAGVILNNESNYDRARADYAQSLAEILSASSAAAVDFNDPLAAQEAADAFRVNRQVRWIGLYNRNGDAIAGFERSGAPPPDSIKAIPEATDLAVRATAPIVQSGQTIGTVYFEVDREAASRRGTRYLILFSLFAIAALVVIGVGVTQAQLRRANDKLGDRATALAAANEMLADQMEERAKAEEQLRQSQKMQALGQLTGGIAHDFNNLLTVIQGSADMLRRPELAETKRIRFAEAILMAAENAAALTSQLLAFARRQPLKAERLELNGVLREMADLIDRTMGERIHVKLELRAPDCMLEVDRAQLQSSILNIASNARDAMPAGGVLRIVTRKGDNPDDVVIEFKDSGQGMDAETLERVFEPFFTTKGPGKGTGLGLSQVYGFASQSGGDVKVTSVPGEGTTISMVLPGCESAADASNEPALVKADGRTLSASILVVEDNEQVAAFAEALLVELGHDVTRVASGEEALERCRSRPFDLVFSDVVMPGMGGLKLAEVLAAEMPSLPVVLATGYSQQVTEMGASGRPVILKPYRIAALTEAIEAELGRTTDGSAGSEPDSD